MNFKGKYVILTGKKYAVGPDIELSIVMPYKISVDEQTKK
jgi:hypothetical protein